MQDVVLPLDAFIRAVGVTRETPHMMFLGAGASISSGMPSAQMCIWDWKRDIFITNNVGLENQFAELSLASVRQRIQDWLDRQGFYPPDGAAEEYSVYAETCFPIPDRRRAYFQEKTRQAQPHIGYQLLSLLAEAKIIDSVWTTNFDGLVARAAAAFTITPIEIGVDSKDRIGRTRSRSELLIVSFHGDYRYDKLKNTSEELRQQEQVLKEALVTECQGRPVIVCGYSGRDETVMGALFKAFDRKGGGTLYWCVQDPDTVPELVSDLIRIARKNGNSAYLVPIHNFDDLMVRLSFRCLNEEGRNKANRIIESKASPSELPRKAFQVDGGRATAILKSNAFEMECPSEVLAFGLHAWPDRQVWKWLRQQTENTRVVAVPLKGQILALGTVDEVKACFGDNIKGKVGRSPVSGFDLRHEDGAVVSLMRTALVRVMASEGHLDTDGREELWLPEVMQRKDVAGVPYHLHDSVEVFFRHIDGRQYLVLMPSVKVLRGDGDKADHEVVKTIRASLLGWQHNDKFNEAVNQWRTRLLGTDKQHREYEFPPACGSTFRFQIRKSPVFAQVAGLGGPALGNAETKLRNLVRYKGIEIKEPRLQFSNRAGTGSVLDVHPVRGVASNRPFDYSLTMQGFGTTVRLGVVCPKAETKMLQGYLQNSAQRINPGKSESDYLVSYPGFQNAFGVELEVAEPGGPGWIVCGEPDESRDERANSVEIAKRINHAIEVLQASFAPHVILIFFPDRWARYRGFETESEHFDVHDFVKANSVRRGIGTQFLEQSTLRDSLQCRVWWWLSLAFYVKAMRTPWVLEGLNPDTAFVGLGMSPKPAAERGKHIVLGCSHIYSARGEGLQYRLSKVENPVFIGKNPFLSRDDARRVGEQIRELFFDSRGRLPPRVVIHKRTQFTKEERLGLREGLSGVPDVEMLEIVVDHALRYMASVVDARGNLHEDSYPVRRGTVLKLDDFSALVWVHGVTLAVSSGRRYYQGKRRIPAPLIVRRHAGQSDLRTIAEEIVGLSKMNWNTFDLYTKMPATVQSSNEIARIGSLLERFGARSYDFRLFI